MNHQQAPSELAEEMGAPADVHPDHRVTVVIPAFNEASHIDTQIREVREVLGTTGWSFEIIVVDDGSTDGTGERAAAAGVHVLRHSRNRGYGTSLRKGISAAKHDWILIIDADGTYPVAAIPALLEAADGNEMVVGARTGNAVHIPLARRPAKWCLQKLASYLAGQHFPDLNSGLRLIRKQLVEQYEHLLPVGFSFTTTITLATACNDHETKYISIDYHPRVGKSKIRPQHAYDFMLLILRTIVFFNPLKVFVPVGALLAVAGIIKFAYDFTQNDLSESAVLGVLGALIIWSLGLLADQNSRLARHR